MVHTFASALTLCLICGDVFSRLGGGGGWMSSRGSGW